MKRFLFVCNVCIWCKIKRVSGKISLFKLIMMCDHNKTGKNLLFFYVIKVKQLSYLNHNEKLSDPKLSFPRNMFNQKL